MGLSNGERLQKITWAVRALVNIGNKLRDHRNQDEVYLPMSTRESINHFCAITDNLWHQFLGSKRNGGFWFLGGEHNNALRDTNTPWAVAVAYHVSHSRPESNMDRRLREYFDPFDGFLSIKGLLSGEIRGLFYEAFAWMEQLSYALRRYDDALLRRLPDLNKSISDIYGVLFEVFQSDVEYAKAYVAHQLLEHIYKPNELREVLNKLCFHHKFSGVVQEYDLQDFIAWDRWRLSRKPSNQNRLILAMRMAGRRFHHQHQLNTLIKLTRVMGIKKSKLRREYAACQEAHKEHQDDGLTQYRKEQRESEAAFLHGWGGQDWLWKPKKKDET
jgi:hypothetical protein